MDNIRLKDIWCLQFEFINISNPIHRLDAMFGIQKCVFHVGVSVSVCVSVCICASSMCR